MNQYIAESSSSLHSLITQASVDTQKYYCPFLERGFCREQSRCSFSHDCNLSTKIPTDYCHFYLANQCLYGQECKFLHTEPQAESNHEFLADPNVEAIDPASAYGFIAADLGSDDPNDDHDEDEEFAEANGEDHEHDGGRDELDSDLKERGESLANERLTKPALESEGFMYKSNTPNNDRSFYTNEPSHAPFWQDASTEITQQNDSTPASSSSKLKASRLSHRCAMVAPSSSSSSASPSSSTSLAAATLLAKLQHIAPHPSSNSAASAQISNDKDGSAHSKSNTANATSSFSSSSSSAKGAWQNTRLIASIRNNLVESNSSGSNTGTSTSSSSSSTSNTLEADLPLCPYSLTSGECPFPEGRCTYLHGLVCDLCYCACLHPYNEKQRHQHREECLREHEREMELSFAVQRSKDKVCGICMDTVVEKKPITSSRFGILEKCNHIFCLDCIRKWRGTKQFDSRTIRACPECRVSSDFVVPSKYWVEEQDDKDRLITDYKSALRAKPCRYFKEGKGECPFAGSCFYKHAYPDGSLAVLDAPKPRRRLYGARGPTTSVANYILWNILTSTDEDDLSINDDLQSLYDEVYNIDHNDSDWEP